MANQAKMTIRVTSARGSSTVDFSTTGRYVSLTTGGISQQMLAQPIQSTASAKAFWLGVLAAVQLQLNSL